MTTPQTTIFDAILELVALQTHLDKTQLDPDNRLAQIYAASVYHALSEFTLGTGASFNDEEHRTSAFMAYLGSCVSWYNLFSRMSGAGEDQQLSIMWNAQNKKTTAKAVGENTTGGDFGIAVKGQDGNYNLIFFQAKQDDAAYGEHRLDINKVPAAYTKDGEFTPAGSAANEEFVAWCFDERFDGRSDGASHQFVKLANQNEYPFSAQFAEEFGSPLPRPVESWTHYVVWRNTAPDPDKEPPAYAMVEPLCISFDEVAAHLRKELLTRKRAAKERPDSIFGKSGFTDALRRIPLVDTESSFAKLLISGMGDKPRGWLSVTLAQAKDIVGHFSKLGVEWNFVEDSSGEGAALAAAMNAISKDAILKQLALQNSQTDLAKIQTLENTLKKTPRLKK